MESVTTRFYETFPALLEQFGERGRQATREDLTYHLEFIRPVLEFGILQPFTDYLHWLASVLASRNVPTSHLPLSLDWLREFFTVHLPGEDAEIVAVALEAGKSALLEAKGATHFSRLGACRRPGTHLTSSRTLLLAGDHKKAAAVFRQARDESGDYVGTALHLVQRAMYRIGQKWQENQISVAREHLATAIAQGILSQEYCAGPARARFESEGRTRMC